MHFGNWRPGAFVPFHLQACKSHQQHWHPSSYQSWNHHNSGNGGACPSLLLPHHVATSCLYLGNASKNKGALGVVFSGESLLWGGALVSVSFRLLALMFHMQVLIPSFSRARSSQFRHDAPAFLLRLLPDNLFMEHPA